MKSERSAGETLKSPPDPPKGTIGTTIRSKILIYLEEKDYPVAPREIAQKLNIKPNSVRPTLISLLREGKISRPNRGYYITKPIHGVGELPRVHNLVLSINPYRLEVKIPDFRVILANSKLRILFGTKRQRVTWFVSNDGGLDLDGLSSCLEVLRLRHYMATDEYVSWDRLKVSTVEINQDYRGVRWDRSGSITLKSFMGPLERIYQKGSLLRSEVKVQPQSLMDIYTLLKGGVTPFNVVQTQMMSVQRQDGIIKQNERILSYMASILRYMKALLERVK